MVRIITNEFGGANILITSDHGFLYTYSPLKEDDKVDKTTESQQDIEIGRRYAIMQKGAQPQYLLPVKFLEGNSEYKGFAPREGICIKMKGGGLNFVHGGVSLQEMVIPVIEYHFPCNDSNGKTVNDTATIIADKTTDNVQERIFRSTFNLKPLSYSNTAAYYLIIADENGLPVSCEEFQIDIAFAVDDFDFFN